MILIFIFYLASVSSVLSQNCPANFYGPGCNLTCNNCLYSCDSSGSCINSTCKPQYYGNSCIKLTPQPSKPSIIIINQSPTCVGLVSVDQYISSVINPTVYNVQYDTSLSGNFITATMNPSSTPQKFESSIALTPSTIYRFGITFTFEDIDLYGQFPSIISPLFVANVSSNCMVTEINGTTVVTLPTIPPIPPSTVSVNPPVSTAAPPISSDPSTGTVNPTSATIISSSSSIIPQSSSPGTVDTITSTITSSRSTSLENSNPGTVVPISSTLTSSSTSPGSSDSTTTILTVSTQNVSPKESTTSRFYTDISSGPPTTLSPTTPTNLLWNAITWNLLWTPPTNNVGLLGFLITINGTLNISTLISVPTANSLNLSQLNYGTLYNVVITALYSNSFTSNSILLWTKPLPFSGILLPPQISNILANQFMITFPSYSNYNGIINVYYIAVVKKGVTTTRSKRDVLSCSNIYNIPLVPSGAPFYYASNVAPSASGVIIGSGSTYPTLQCANNQLDPGTVYTVYTAVGSIVNGIGEYAVSQNDVTTSPGPNVGMIVGIVIGILLLLLIVAIILLIYFLKCRKRSGHLYGVKGPYEDSKPMSHLFWSSIIDKMDSRNIILDDKTIHDGLTFKDEYDNLPERPCDDHASVEFVVLDHSHDHTNERVIQNFANSNFRATFIDGYIKKRSFISLQTPYNEQTNSDFWSMVFDENVGQIVTITQEGQSINQNIYWPTKSKVYSQVEVSLMTEDHFAYFDVRKFKIQKMETDENIKVTQYHYRNWPSNDKFVNIISFLQFHQLIKKSESIIFGPTVIHCQFGCPLNAVYMGFDILNDQISKEKEVNVYRVIAQLRRNRPNTMVKIDQYMAIYDLLFESYLSGGFVVDGNLKRLMNSSSVTFWRFLENQFEYLNNFRKVTLQTVINNKMFYTFDSEEHQNSIILLKSPNNSSEETINMWRTVFDNNISIIIDITNGDTNKSYYHAYDFNIQVENVVEHKYRVFEQNVSVTNAATYVTKNVVVYSVNSQNGVECPAWIELISNIIDNGNYNLLVFNSEGSCLSTVFIACFNAAFKLYRVNFVSVYFTIRALQSSGHPVLMAKEDLSLIYQFLEMWIDSKMYDLIQNREKKLEFLDQDYHLFTNGPYGESNLDFISDYSQSPYGTVNKANSFKMTNNLYDARS